MEIMEYDTYQQSNYEQEIHSSTYDQLQMCELRSIIILFNYCNIAYNGSGIFGTIPILYLLTKKS